MIAPSTRRRVAHLEGAPRRVAARLAGECGDPPDAWRALIAGEIDALGIGQTPADAQTAGLFPGAFNPLHDGHRRMVELAAARLAAPVALEISIENVDKPLLGAREAARRVAQLAAHQGLWLTRAPTFEHKAALFPGTTFVAGADTIVRVADPRYYGGDRTVCRAALDAIAARGCRFLVFGRVVGGRFRTLADLVLPDPLRAICTGIPEQGFREDISSTAIRNRAGC